MRLYLLFIFAFISSSAVTQNCNVRITPNSQASIVCGKELQLSADFNEYWIPQGVSSGKIVMTGPEIVHSVMEPNTYKRYLNSEWQTFEFWDDLENFTRYPEFYCIQFTSPSVGFIGGCSMHYGNPLNPVLYKTTNGGDSWFKIVNAGNPDSIFAVHFLNENLGFIATGPQILKTTDGGISWQVVMLNANFGYNSDIQFVTSDVGYALDEFTFYKTTDGGETWDALKDFDKKVYDLLFIDELNGFIVGRNGVCIRTSDGGNTWNACNVVGLSSETRIFDIHFYDAMNGFMVADDFNIYHSGDGGLNWYGNPAGSTSYPISIYVYDDLHGFAGGMEVLKFPGINIPEFSWTGEALSSYTVNEPVAYPNQTQQYVVSATVAGPYQTCTASDTLSLTVSPLSISIVDPISSPCTSQKKVTVTTNYTGSPSNITYSWDPPEGLTDPSVLEPWVTITGDQTYQLHVETANGCLNTGILNVSLEKWYAPDICLITVNNNKNEIVWNYSGYPFIGHYSIYKETGVTNDFVLIGTVPYGANSVFTDTASQPNVSSNRYKITMTDTCGLETDLSLPHKSMHLSISQGQNDSWNLNWEPYLGFEVQSYNIYRGTSADSLQMIATVASSVNQYTDLIPPTDVFYQIEVICPDDCNTGSRSFSTSKSNIEHGSNLGFMEKNYGKLCLYPNPTIDYFKIVGLSLLFKDDKPELKIYSADGVFVEQIILKSPEDKINISHLRQGVYILKGVGEKYILTGRVIKFR